MKKLLNPQAILRQVIDTVRRFPLAVGLLLAAAAQLVWAIAAEKEPSAFWLSAAEIGMMAGVAAAVALEVRSRWMGGVIGAVVTAAVAARIWFLPELVKDYSNGDWVEILVIGFVSFASIYVTPFLRCGRDVEWWNYALGLTVRIVLGAFFAGVLMAGLTAALAGIDMLFGVDMPDELYGVAAVVCFQIFAPMYVLAGVPRGDEKRDGRLLNVQALKVMGLYIMGSLLAVYTLILYIYLAKIVFAWELPTGGVAWLVTTVGVGGLLMTLLLYPLRMQGVNRAVGLIAKWIGPAILPLLVLMTVGIARRVSDHGWTPNRAYILLLNVWFYAIYAWMFFTRGRRVKMIVISAVVAALVSSVGPWSLARVPVRENEDGGAELTEEFHNRYEVDNRQIDIAAGYTRVAHIDLDSHSDEGEIVMSVDSTHVVFTLRGEERLLRLPLERFMRDSVIRGDGFEFHTQFLAGTRYGATKTQSGRDSIAIDYIHGFLFY